MPDSDPPPGKSRISAIRMGRGFEVAWEAALSIVLGAVLGIYADRWLGTSPILMIVLLTMGAIVAFRRLIAFGKQSVKDGESPRP